MKKREINNKPDKGKHKHALPGQITHDQKKKDQNARKEAEEDMEDDKELTAHSPNDDLDEGETARLGENTDLI